jgi:hypothetical protein
LEKLTPELAERLDGEKKIVWNSNPTICLMKLLRFSFKREAIWITALSFAPMLTGLFVALVVWFLRS